MMVQILRKNKVDGGRVTVRQAREMWKNGVSVLLVLFGIFICVSSAAGAALFGPKQYVRISGGTTSFADTFLATAGDARLFIENGNWDGDHRVDNQVSSARILFNGVQIYGPSDFNKNVHILQSRVTLLPENTLSVELNGSPDSYLTIQVTRPSVVLNADPEILSPGSSSLLSWVAADATTCSLQPGNGTIPVTGSLTVSPEATTTYILTAVDSVGVRASASKQLTVDHSPVATAQSAVTDEDMPLFVVVSGTDEDGDPLTYRITTAPANGTLNGTAPDLIYTPNANFNGTDSFSFVSNDGMVDSAPAMVSITVNPVNDAPAATDDTATTDEDTAVVLADLLANDSDVDGDALSISGFSQPAHGSVANGNGGSLLYTPAENYNGADSFTYSVSDGTTTSTATVTVTVNAVNDPPTAQGQAVTVDEDTTANIALAGTDVENDPLSYRIETPPTNGVLTGTAPNLVYTPNADYNGTDAFSFVCNDGMVDSVPATVAITVNAINDAPTAEAGSDQTVVRGDTVILNGSSAADIDGDALTYQWSFVSRPEGSTAVFSDASLLHPSFTADLAGVYEVELVAKDGTADSVPATLRVTANPRTVTVPEVVSLPQAEAETAITTADLTLGITTTANSDTVPVGKVIDQLPAAGGSVEEGTMVDLVVSLGPVAPVPVVNLTVIPDSIQTGSSTTLQWTSTDADGCTITPDIGAVSANGSVTVTPTTTTTYFITATGPGGFATSSVTVHVTNPTDLPTVTMDSALITIAQGESATLSWSSSHADSAGIDNGIGPVAVAGSVSVSPAHTTTYTVTVVGPKGAASDRTTVLVTGAPASLPEGSFGQQHESKIPADSTVGSYDAARFSLLTGTVYDADGNPLAGVAVTVHDQPAYGTAFTDNDGEFAMPVEGGGAVTLVYRKSGLLEVQRGIDVSWNEIARVETVTMIAEDRAATTFTLDGNPGSIFTHRSSTTSDTSGEREITTVFTGDTHAYAVDEQGNPTQPLSTLTVRATEFPSPEAMPAGLPPASAYTYCVELSVDGVARVKFDKPVTNWVKNFLGFEVGVIVPVGYYDRIKGTWIPSDNGLVVKLLDTDNDGVVDALDADGDGLPNDLSGNGMFSDEVAGLNDPATYLPDTTYWRFSLTHFTPVDANWPWYFPDGWQPPNPNGDPSTDQPTDNQQDDPCSSINSFVKHKSRTLHEDIAVPGTDITLHYASDRAAGNLTAISIPASGDTVPDMLKRIIVRAEVAGRVLEQELPPAPNQKATIVWDGLDYEGKPVGPIKAKIKVGFAYQALYGLRTSRSGNADFAFGRPGYETSNLWTRLEIVSWKTGTMNLSSAMDGVTDPEWQIAQGWTLSPQHHLDPRNTHLLYKGDGMVESRRFTKIVDILAGTGTQGFSGDGGPAKDAAFYYSRGIAVDAVGNVYFSDVAAHCVRKIDRQGIITTELSD